VIETEENDMSTEHAPPSSEIDDTLELSDEEWEEQAVPRRKRTSRLTIALLAASLAGFAFVGGALAQKQFGDEEAGAGGGAGGGDRASRIAQLLGGQGGEAGGNAAGGPFGGGQGGSGGLGGLLGGGSGGAAAQGQVKAIKGRTLYVETPAGKTVKVSVPVGLKVSTTVSKPLLEGVNPGDTVTVQGEEGKKGTVKASGVTVTTGQSGGRGGAGTGAQPGGSGG
jgi:hypothetical protein